MKKLSILLLVILISFLACQPKSKNIKTESKSESTPDISALKDVELIPLWETDTLLTTSESVIFDEERNVLYVACINGVSPWEHDGDGFIARVDLEGKIIDRKWVEGISGPKGMGIQGDNLYVTDIDQVVKIDIKSGEITERFPIEGGQNINDLTIAHDGDIFVSDSKGSSIYIISNGEVKQLFNDPLLEGINGLFMNQDTLFFGSRKDGMVYRIQHGDLSPRPLVKLPGLVDGLEKYKDAFIMTNWAGKIHFVDAQWNQREKLNLSEKNINTADIEIIEEENLLLVPTFFDNRVIAFKIQH